MNTADQWKDHGVCSWCRRKKYCLKECSALKRRRTMTTEKAAQAILGLSGIEKMNEFIFEAIENGGKKE